MSRKILVVEDDKGIVKVLRIFFKVKGFESLVAASGAEGIDFAREQKPDVMLLDVLLPDISGFEVLETVRKFSNVPIIVFSANSSAVKGAMLAGANDSIAKPFNPENLLQKIEALLPGGG